MALASDLVGLARTLLVDPNANGWTDAELLEYLNEALQVLARDMPTLFAITEEVQLVAGARQTLPAGGLAISGVIGAAPFDFKAMNIASPDWRSHTAGDTRSWTQDPVDPKVFWVYPPQPSTSPATETVEYIKAPTTLISADTVPTPSAYDQVLVDYMLYRAYSKDHEYAGDEARAGFHKAKYEAGVSNGEAG